MAHDLDKIINLLREMQRSNNANADSFDRLLTELSEKFDSTNNGASTELIGAYISELTKSVDDKYSITLAKFIGVIIDFLIFKNKFFYFYLSFPLIFESIYNELININKASNFIFWSNLSRINKASNFIFGTNLPRYWKTINI